MFWKLIQSSTNRLETLAVWSRLFELSPDRCLTVLSPSDELADTLFLNGDPQQPCRIVQHHDHTFAAVPVDGDASFPVNRYELTLYRIDMAQIGLRLAAILQLEPAFSPVAECEQVRLLGDQLQNDASALPVYLALCDSSASLMSAVAQLASLRLPCYGLLVPTREPLTIDVQQLITATRGVVRVLGELIDLTAPKTLPPTKRVNFSPIALDTATDSEILSERESELLVALQIRGADHADRRISTEALVLEEFGPEADYNSQKHLITRLNKRGLIKSRSGRGGGIWLTPEGKVRAEGLNRQIENGLPFRSEMKRKLPGS